MSGTPPSGQWGGVSDGSAGRGPGAIHQGGGWRGGGVRENPDAKVNLDEYNLFSRVMYNIMDIAHKSMGDIMI